MSRSLKSHFVPFLCVFALLSLLPQQGFAQRSSLPFPLRVLYDSFDADMEMVEGEWWLTFDDLLDETALPVYAYLDEENDLTLGLLLEDPQFDIEYVLSLKDEVERWKFMEGSSGELLVYDWIFETTEEEILVEFILSIAEINVFLNSLPSSPEPDEMRFDVAGCMRGIEEAMVGAPTEMRQFFRSEPYCNCLSNLVDEDPDLLLYMLDITSPRSIEAMRTCWPNYCPNCATLGLTFEEVMLGLQEDAGTLAEMNDITRRKFIRGCVSTGMDLSNPDEIGVTYSQMESYCECAYDKLIGQQGISVTDFEDPDGERLRELFGDCILEHLEVESLLNEDIPVGQGSSPLVTENQQENLSNSVAIPPQNEQEVQEQIINGFVNSCVVGDVSANWESREDYSLGDARLICECAAEKILAQEPITQEEVSGDADPIARMLEDCEVQLQLEKSSRTSDLSRFDPIGCVGRQEIPIVRDPWAGTLEDPFSGAWRIKLQLGSIEHDFILDTNLHSLLINEVLAQELIDKGILQSDRLDPISVQTGDGKLTAERRKLSRLSIGGCDFLDFEVGVVDHNESFCGRGLLDYFDSWTVDEEGRRIFLFAD